MELGTSELVLKQRCRDILKDTECLIPSVEVIAMTFGLKKTAQLLRKTAQAEVFTPPCQKQEP